MPIRAHLREDAESYKYAFLAARVAAILERSSDARVQTEDVRRLKEAQALIEKIIVGAEMVTGRKTHVFASHESLKVLSVILNPVHSIQTIIHQAQECRGEEADELLDALRRVSRYLDLVAGGGRVIQHADQTIAHDFFKWLADSFLQNISKYPMDRDLSRPKTTRFALWSSAT